MRPRVAVPDRPVGGWRVVVVKVDGTVSWSASTARVIGTGRPRPATRTIEARDAPTAAAPRRRAGLTAWRGSAEGPGFARTRGRRRTWRRARARRGGPRHPPPGPRRAARPR